MPSSDPLDPKKLPEHTEDDVDEQDDGEEDGVEATQATNGEAKKKKKKKKPKKKKQEAKQSDPPRIGLSKFYPDGNYPEGELVEYTGNNAFRTTSEEKRYLERMQAEDEENTYANVRKAAEVHRTIRQYAKKTIRPGMKMIDIANEIEDGVRALVEGDGQEAGIAFPTGLSANNCAAHYSPNPGDDTVLEPNSVLKVDFGVHVKGRIVDSAFTITFDPTYEKLLEAVKAATNAGVKASGIDARLGEVGGIIQEVMESYEVIVGTDVHRVKCIENLNGHSIHPYRIHGDKSVPIVDNGDQTKMEEGEYFAIETFGSTGRGKVIEAGECSHYARITDRHVPLRLATAKSLLKAINTNFGTLPFCRRYLDRIGEVKHIMPLNHLVAQGIVHDYPPLWDIKGSMTAQFEHTILLRPTRKEVVSRGPDY